MTRCHTPRFAPPIALLLATGLLLSASAQAQYRAPLSGNALVQQTQTRNFPPASVYGTVVFGESGAATIGRKSLRTAPGLRIFDTQNRLVFAHSLSGQKIQARYLIEPSTGLLHTVWILSPHEIPPRKWFGRSQSSDR